MKTKLRIFLFPALLLSCSPALALDPTALNGDDYETREAATQRLLSDEVLTLEQITELYAQVQTTEQRHRLLDGNVLAPILAQFQFFVFLLS